MRLHVVSWGSCKGVTGSSRALALLRYQTTMALPQAAHPSPFVASRCLWSADVR